MLPLAPGPLRAEPRAPAYLSAGNRALDPALSAANFAAMPVWNALKNGDADTLLCFFTAAYQDKLLSLFHLITGALPARPPPGEEKRVRAIHTTAWRIKRGALALEYYCGLNDTWPRQWRVTRVRPGDRDAFRRRIEDIDSALEKLKKLID